MRDDWPAFRLEDIVDVKSGKRIPKGYSLVSECTDHPYIRIADMKNRKVCLTPDVQYVPAHVFEKIKRYTTNAADVLLSIVGTVGLVSITDASLDGASLTENAVKLVNPRGVAGLFLYYWLSSPFGQQAIKKGIVGSTQPKLPIYNIKQLSIHLPPLFVQRRIADILGALDDKIECNRRINQTLEEMAQALYKHWFVDFGPFRGGEFVDSVLGEIPDGWRVGKLEELLFLQRGFDLPFQDQIPGQYPILTSSGITGMHNEYKVKGPGVTTGRSGMLGNVFLIYEDFWPHNTSLWVKEFRNSRPHHAYLFLKSVNIASLNAGSAVATLNRNDIHSLPAIIPPLQIIERFEELVAPLFRSTHNHTKESETLTRTRDYLLPKLLSGEVEVNAAE